MVSNKEGTMIKRTQTAVLMLVAAGVQLSWSTALLAAATGNLGVSASVMERCRVDFSEGSADYFQSCASVEVKATGTHSNVRGELTAVEASEDPYYLDRDPDSHGIAAGTQAPQNVATLADRRSKAPKVVTIHY